MADCRFAQDQLAKYGWVTGSGLGKDGQGMTNPIKVSIKNNKKGVGHDPGKEFTDNWWDQMFNKAASRVMVDNTEDGVDIRKVTAEDNDVKVQKTVLYGNFIKTSTLTNTGDGCEEVWETEKKMPEEDVLNSKKYTVTDDEMFLMCGGRTAHKGARHGLKLNGKLKRIEEHEAKLLADMQKKSSSKENNVKRRIASKRTRVDCDGVDGLCDKDDETCSNNKIVKTKKKKKRSKKIDNVISDIDGDNDEEKVKSKKSKKSKRDHVNDCDAEVNRIETNVTSYNETKQQQTDYCGDHLEANKSEKKKKKKKKKSRKELYS